MNMNGTTTIMWTIINLMEKFPPKRGIGLHSGNVLYYNSDMQHMNLPLDYLIMAFPNHQMQIYSYETNKELRKNRKRETNATELYKLSGILVLITRFDTTSRARIWSTVSQNKYIPAMKLDATTGIYRQKFDDL